MASVRKFHLLAALALSVVFATAASGQTAKIPKTLSPEGQAALAAMSKSPQPPEELGARRAMLDRVQAEFGAKQQARYPVDIKSDTLAGVPVRLISAKNAKPTTAVLLNLHGGGFNADSGSLTENIPIASLTGIPVVAVLYRLAPEALYPAAIDDALAVYRELLKTHAPSEIAVYGTSAGAVIGPQLMMRLRAEGLPLPAALGVFSGDADLTQSGQSALSHNLDFATLSRPYYNKTPSTDPAVSPLLGDLKGFPPTLCMTSTDDFFLSSTSNFCRGLGRVGVEQDLIVFDGYPHAFWAYIAAPESDEAFAAMASFLAGHVAVSQPGPNWRHDD